jgi:hypothetical protein
MLKVLFFLSMLGAAATAFADSNNQPSATSTDRPQSNTAIQELDRKAHPAEIRAVGAPAVRTVPGSGAGNMDSSGGSSMGLGISIPLSKPPEAVPQVKSKIDTEDSSEE